MRRFVAFVGGFVAAEPSFAQEIAQPPPYCADLKRVTEVAMGRDRLVPITGNPRDGNFYTTTQLLTGWSDCSIYGTGIYTCDSEPIRNAEEAHNRQAATMRDVLACLGTAWAEVKDRSSPGYVVLHPLRGAISVTLSLDEKDRAGHVVRLTVFIRR